MDRSARPRLLLWGALAFGTVGGCNSSSPMDMWIAKDPEAGADFQMPAREAGISLLDGGDDADAGTINSGDTSGTAGTNGTAGAGGAGGASGAGGDTGDAGGAAAGGAAGAAGSGGAAGATS